MRLARDRMARLVVASVDAGGVTNEQAVGYQAYNLSRYRKAEARLRAWRSDEPERYRQRWHLAEDARPDPIPGGFVTGFRRDGR